MHKELYNLCDGDVRIATTIVSFSSNNHIVIWWSHGHSEPAPGIHVIVSSYSTSSTFVAPDRPMLIKRLNAIDRWLLNASWDVNVVSVAIGGHGAFVCSTWGRIVRSEIFNNVVLNQRISSPSIYSEITVAIWIICSGVIDGSISSWIPSLSAD